VPPKTLSSIQIDGRNADYRGKVREIFDRGDHLIIVATDRLSAFDVVLPTPIPGKGRILTRLSTFWFEALEGILPTHFVTDRVERFPAPFRDHKEELDGRSMLVRKARRLDVECVVRGYLAGSGWGDYVARGEVSGVRLPAGLRQADPLPEPIFTPATKNDTGHDENISFEEALERHGPIVEEARRLSLALYTNIARYTERHGIILADTKFEFGVIDGQLALIDEVASPDSSRFWDRERYRPGESPESFDKQFVRDWLLRSGWNRQPPGPEIPEEIVAKTVARYDEAARRLIDPDRPLSFKAEGWTWPDVKAGR
jgi:phosphoribosylaminoimidazole-succinocarboxamide synthase